jgi:hypothetical protein
LQVLFAGPFMQEISGLGAHNYDVAPDGQRFVMLEPVAGQGGTEAPTAQIHVVLNWFQELTARVPVQ